MGRADRNVTKDCFMIPLRVFNPPVTPMVLTTDTWDEEVKVLFFFTGFHGISWDFKLSNFRFEIQDPKWKSIDSKNWSHETSPKSLTEDMWKIWLKICSRVCVAKDIIHFSSNQWSLWNICLDVNLSEFGRCLKSLKIQVSDPRSFWFKDEKSSDTSPIHWSVGWPSHPTPHVETWFIMVKHLWHLNFWSRKIMVDYNNVDYVVLCWLCWDNLKPKKIRSQHLRNG